MQDGYRQKAHINLLSRYKIIDNLRRSLLEISIMISLILTGIVGAVYYNKKDYRHNL